MRTFIHGNKRFTEVTPQEWDNLSESKREIILVENEEQEKEIGFFKIEEVS